MALVVVLVLSGVALILGINVFGLGREARPLPIVEASYDASGRIVATQQADVASLQGGVVRTILREPGTEVTARQELARVEGPNGVVEVVTAPFAGTLLVVVPRVGDTVAAGALIAIVGDLSTLRIETTDVDEYLIPTITVGQPVEITVDALPGRTFRGRVETVSLAAQRGTGSRLQYPVQVALERADSALRPSMTARLRFGPRPPR